MWGPSMSWYVGYPRKRRRDPGDCARCGGAGVPLAYYLPALGPKAGLCYACDERDFERSRAGWTGQRVTQE